MAFSNEENRIMRRIDLALVVFGLFVVASISFNAGRSYEMQGAITQSLSEMQAVLK